MADDVSAAMDDYIRAAYLLQEERPEAPVSTTRLAARLRVSAPSASAMLKRLAERGLVVYAGYHGARLSDDGLRRALDLTRRHRLLEQFLSEVLGMPWEEVHDEADRLEHALSDEVEARIASRLGHPLRDPHGDPIPSDALVVSELPTEALDQLAAGVKGRFVRIRDPRPEMLLHLSEQGIRVGDRIEVLGRQPSGATLIRAHHGTRSVGPDLAPLMRVEVER